MVEEITQIANEKLIPLNHVLMSDFTLQMSLVILIVGFIAIFLINRRISKWVQKKKSVALNPLPRNL